MFGKAGRPRKSDTGIRKNHVGLYLNDEEQLHLKRLKERRGIKTGDLIRSLIEREYDEKIAPYESVYYSKN